MAKIVYTPAVAGLIETSIGITWTASMQVDQLQPGAQLGKYRIIKPLGAGGMGEVFLAENVELTTKKVALKTLPAVTTQGLTRFRREAETAAKIDHPNVVTIFDFSCDRNIYYLVMRYVEGTDLARKIEKQQAPLPWKQALKVIALAARGAAEVHRYGLIHRDIKPANIMVTKDGSQVVLMDFGLVREMDSDDSASVGLVIGTPPYMSPEQARGEELDPRSDVFSLGSTLYYLLTTRAPFESPTRNRQEILKKVASGQRPKSVHEVNPMVPREVSDYVARIMAPRREDRIATAKQLEAELLALMRRNFTPPAVMVDTDASSSDQTQGKPMAVPELDLVPLEPVEDTFAEKIKQHWRWLDGGISVGLVLIVGMVAIFAALPGGCGKGTQVALPTTTAPRVDHAPSQVERYPGMVKVPAGRVRIGNDEAPLKTYGGTIQQFNGDANLIQQFVQMCLLFPDDTTHVPAFMIDKYEVTNAEYLKFVQATKHPAPSHWQNGVPPSGQSDHPVVNVYHADAQAYAEWAKKKLPTHAQWMRAARGESTDLFPWGNTWEDRRANVLREFGGTTAVNATPRDVSPLGVYNMAGNVRELIRDRWTYQGEGRVVARGGDWQSAGNIYSPLPIVTIFVLPKDAVNPATGFRCVVEEP